MKTCGAAVIKTQHGVVPVRAARDLWLSSGWVGPAPGIAKPQCWDQVQFGILWSAIKGFHANANIFGTGLGILNEDVEVAVIVEDAGIQQLIFHSAAVAPAVLLDQLTIRKFSLRILVQHLHVAVGGSVIQVEVILFYIFTVIALAGVQTKHPLFQDRIFA